MTIRSKLILLYSGLLAIIIVAFGIALFAVARWVLVTSVDNTLSDTADQIWQQQPHRRSPRVWRTVAARDLPAARPRFFPRVGVVVQVWQLAATIRICCARRPT